ncbi:polysaccharide export protein EpsE [Aquincola sp. MAHUQ-54]|uniref:Polysaccharide export protein EpsE n=1 Tax=Aquincola agrisoli TaxID=3119538 RepID=A0AAW9Q940_9BURK
MASFKQNNWARACVGAVVASMALAASLPLHAQNTAPNAPIPASSTPEYRLGAGDVVRITVYQNPDLTLETRVSESGVVSYPLIGQVRLGGQSISAAERAIADGLRNGNFVKQPQVTIAVLQVRGNQANVLGQVNRPGRYPLEVADMKLTDLLAMAGGTAATGADIVVITGTRNGRPYRAEVDLPTIFASQSRGEDIVIQNGDAIWVDRQPMVYIYGEVQRPGPMRLERGMTLMQSLATGGGLNQRGTEKGIRVHRKGADGKVQIITPAMDDVMRDGDVVYVRESLF